MPEGSPCVGWHLRRVWIGLGLSVSISVCVSEGVTGGGNA